MRELNELEDRAVDAGAALTIAAIRFLAAHGDIRELPCPTASSFVLAVDRYVDAVDALPEEGEIDAT